MGELNSLLVFCALYSGVVSLTLWFTTRSMDEAKD